MGLFDFLVEQRSPVNLGSFKPKIFDESKNSWFITPKARSGIQVNEQTALGLTPVLGCIRVISETLSSVPIKVYKRKKGGGREEVRDISVAELISMAPNDYMVSMIWRESEQSKILLSGNSYCEIVKNNAQEPIGIYPFNIGQCWPDIDKDTGKLIYKYTDRGQQEILPKEKVLHIPGLGFNGIVGFSPIHMAMEAVGLGLAAQAFGSSFFGSGANIAGVLEHPGGGKSLDDAAVKRMRESWKELYGGIDNAHKVAILEEGTKYTRIGIPPEEAQFIEVRKFQIEEIARIYRVPLHLLQSLDKSTNNNIEHQSLEFVKYTMLPWFTRWEEILSWKLLTPLQRKKGFYIEFVVDGLLRGDIKSRYEAYHYGLMDGWLNADEVRERENMNPLPDKLGQQYLVQGAMAPREMIGQEQNNQNNQSKKMVPNGNLGKKE